MYPWPLIESLTMSHSDQKARSLYVDSNHVLPQFAVGRCPADRLVLIKEELERFEKGNAGWIQQVETSDGLTILPLREAIRISYHSKMSEPGRSTEETDPPTV